MIFREGKLQEMESRAEKLEQGTVIFQVDQHRLKSIIVAS